MPAAIVSDGTRDLFASFREPAWHGLGTVFTDEVTDYRQMLDLAGLSGWNVREMPLVPVEVTPTSVGDVETILPARWASTVTGTVATIGNENVILGAAGGRYEIVQNEEVFEFLQSLSDGARWETAGAIKGGRVVFGSLALERSFELDPQGVADRVKAYLMAAASHDGSSNLFGGATPVRVVCENTLNTAIPGLKQTFKIRHTKNAKERMLAEAALWRQTHAYFDGFEKEAQELFAQSVTDKQYFGIVEQLFPKPEVDSRGSVKKWENRQELFAQAWNGAPNAGIRNTAWGVANALTEANQWGRSVRSAENGEENFFAAGAGFDTATNKFRDAAFSAARSLVTA